MFERLTIRLKIVLLSGLCLLSMIALVVTMNLYQGAATHQLVKEASTRMLNRGVQNLLLAKAAEKAQVSTQLNELASQQLRLVDQFRV